MNDKEWLETELKRRGITGKRRSNDDRNRVRNRVGNAIARAIKDQIRPYDARLAQHLQKPRLQKGFSLLYAPAEEVVWELS